MNINHEAHTLMQKGQRFDRIYGLGLLAEDPWAVKEHPQLIGLTTILLAGYIEATTIPPTWLIPIQIIEFLLYCSYILMSIQVIRLLYF